MRVGRAAMEAVDVLDDRLTPWVAAWVCALAVMSMVALSWGVYGSGY